MPENTSTDPAKLTLDAEQAALDAQIVEHRRRTLGLNVPADVRPVDHPKPEDHDQLRLIRGVKQLEERVVETKKAVAPAKVEPAKAKSEVAKPEPAKATPAK